MTWNAEQDLYIIGLIDEMSEAAISKEHLTEIGRASCRERVYCEV